MKRQSITVIGNKHPVMGWKTESDYMLPEPKSKGPGAFCDMEALRKMPKAKAHKALADACTKSGQDQRERWEAWTKERESFKRYKITLNLPDTEATIVVMAADAGPNFKPVVSQIKEVKIRSIILRDGREIPCVFMTKPMNDATAVKHYAKLNHERPPVDVAAVARDAATRAAAAVAPQCERDRARAIESSIKNADNLSDAEDTAFRLRAIDGASYDAIAETLHRTGKTARKYSRAGIKSMLEGVADKYPDLGGMLSRPSKRAAARQDAEENVAQESEDFYEDIDRRLNK